jgi:hypothetical protein
MFIVARLVMHHIGLPILGSPLWFLLLRQRAHIPRKRGGAPDGIELHAWSIWISGNDCGGMSEEDQHVDLGFKLHSHAQ